MINKISWFSCSSILQVKNISSPIPLDSNKLGMVPSELLALSHSYSGLSSFLSGHSLAYFSQGHSHIPLQIVISWLPAKSKRNNPVIYLVLKRTFFTMCLFNYHYYSNHLHGITVCPEV